MNPVTFIYSHDNIFASVKQEASLLAVRRYDKNDNNLFDELVFDEGYLILFRQLFFDAQAEVTVALLAYMRDVPVEPINFETQDFSKDRDFVFWLVMPEDWNFHLAKPVDIKVKEFIVAYIMYRWLETKLPDESLIYLQRTNSALEKARIMLEKRTKLMRFRHEYWEI